MKSERRSRGGTWDDRDSRFEAEERRLLAWYCEHWMVIREGFNVEPVASSSLALSIPSNRLERRCSYPSLFLFLLSPLLPSASSTRMCGYRFRLLPQEHRTTPMLFPAQCREEIVLLDCPVGDGIRRIREPNGGVETGEFYILHLFVFRSLLLPFLFV